MPSDAPTTIWEEQRPADVAVSAIQGYLTESSSHWGITPSSSLEDGYFVASASSELGIIEDSSDPWFPIVTTDFWTGMATTETGWLFGPATSDSDVITTLTTASSGLTGNVTGDFIIGFGGDDSTDQLLLLIGGTKAALVLVPAGSS